MSCKSIAKAPLLLLKTWQLKYWSFLTGLPMTGTKSQLAESVYQHMQTEQAPKQVQERQRSRIVSVDMGIRNLAFCVIDVPPLASRVASRCTEAHVQSWNRMDLLDQQPQSAAVQQNSRASRVRVINKGAFGPSSLSRTAYSVTCELLKHKPDVILIERQRFRSGGAAAIQEWTVRVNMLESMLWACLETLRSHTKHAHETFPQVVEMSPSRVSKFWLAGGVSQMSSDDFFSSDFRDALAPEPAASKQVQRGGKTEKVAVVRSWISGETDDVTLQFNGNSSQIAEAFGTKRRQGGAAELAGGKLDDLADCLLQGVTWVRWQENQQRIKELYLRTSK